MKIKKRGDARYAYMCAPIRGARMIKPLLNAFGFLSIIPVGMADSLEDVAKHMYLFPIVGAVLGLLGGLFLTLLLQFLPVSVSASLGFFFILALTGVHHLDGLLDFGDAFIFRGPRNRRIEILHDSATGVGGFAAGLFVILAGVFATIEFATEGGNIVLFFIVSEALAKLAMVLAASLGTSAFEGTGSVFVKTLKKSRWQVAVGAIITVLITWSFLGVSSIFLLLAPIISALIFVWTSKRLIGGVSGDVFGAVNEVTRLLVMLVILWMHL
jgi:adenosylcobinamide-GDP ribazoletransferase